MSQFGKLTIVPTHLCVEGERACPLEDVGGIRGDAEYFEAQADPEHEQHEVRAFGPHVLYSMQCTSLEL